MGVKSTTRLTREAAEQRFIQAYEERCEAKARIKAEQRAIRERDKLAQAADRARIKLVNLSDTELEDTLERWNDERMERDHGSYGGFDNFLIVPVEYLDEV